SAAAASGDRGSSPSWRPSWTDASLRRSPLRHRARDEILLMAVLPWESAVPPLPQHEPRATARLRGTEAASEPTLEPAPEWAEEPEKSSHHGGQDQHLGGLHACSTCMTAGPSRRFAPRQTRDAMVHRHQAL